MACPPHTSSLYRLVSGAAEEEARPGAVDGPDTIELLAQRDDLAQRLGEAIQYVEHGLGDRAGVEDAAALRRLLDREVQAGLPLRAAFGTGAGRSEATFDIAGARAAIARVQQDPKAGRLATYSQLHALAAKLVQALDNNPDGTLDSPRQLVKEAFDLLGTSCTSRRDATPPL